MKKIVIITGCDSGIGKELCQIFSENGFLVLISYLETNPFSDNQNIKACKMDLRKEEDIGSFFNFCKKYIDEGHEIKYLINNAGVALGGPAENVPIKIYREIFEVNYFGLISLTQKLIPSLIKSKGRIVVMGSMAGKIAIPFLSPYVSTKFALEGFCDSLRREMTPFGVKTILIEPAAVATPIWDKAKKQDSSFLDEKYKKSIKEFTEKFIEAGNSGMNTKKATRQIYKFITKKSPRARYIIAENRFLTFLQTLVPNKLLDLVFLKMFKMDYGSKS